MSTLRAVTAGATNRQLMEANAAILADMKFSVGAVNLFSPHCSCLCYKTFGFSEGLCYYCCRRS